MENKYQIKLIGKEGKDYLYNPQLYVSSPSLIPHIIMFLNECVYDFRKHFGEDPWEIVVSDTVLNILNEAHKLCAVDNIPKLELDFIHNATFRGINVVDFNRYNCQQLLFSMVNDAIAEEINNK